MASLQERNGSFRVMFSYRGKLHTFTFGKVPRVEAAQVDYLLMRIKQKLVADPDGVGVVSFVEHDGNPTASAANPTAGHAPRKAATLGTLRDRYLDTHANGTLEPDSLVTCRIHLAHLCRVLGEGLVLAELTTADLQGYVNRRAATVKAVTVRKEVTTLRSAWNWGGPRG